MKQASIIAVLIAAALVAAFLSHRASEPTPPAASAEAVNDDGKAKPAPGGAADRAASGSAIEPPSAEAKQPAVGAKPPPADVALRVGAEEAKRLRGAILAGFQRAAAPAGAEPAAQPARAGSAAPAAAVPTLDRKYIRSAIEDIAPLIGECFELGRQANRSATPALRGGVASEPERARARAIVKFSIIADAQHGGVVEDSRLDESSEGMTPELSECVRETMYGLQLPAPEGQGRVEVTYPFLLEHNPDQAKPTDKANAQ